MHMKFPTNTKPITLAEVREKLTHMYDPPGNALPVFLDILNGWIAHGSGAYWSPFSRCKELEALASMIGVSVSPHVVRRYLTGERENPSLDTLSGVLSTILWDLERRERGTRRAA